MKTKVTLEDFKALMFVKTGEHVAVSTFGAAFSEAPRCCDLVDAVMASVTSFQREKIGIDTSLDEPHEADGVKHILAFIEAFGSSYFMQGCAPDAVVVPGLGRWVLEPET